ncbi:MAG: SPFH/Band 7/PHB domain protein [Firmicutes bacterium]|nr:SPFH/Band 7/PHB domain protein [Bacillota bacterium]
MHLAIVLLVLVGIGVLLIAALIWSTVRIVPQGYRGVVQHWGKFHRELSPGLALKIPIIESLKLINTKAVTINLTPEPVITADNVSPVIDAYFIYQVVDAKSFLFEIQNPETAIKNIVSATLRSEVGQKKLADVMIHREEINSRLRADLDKATDTWGIRIVQVSIRQVDLTKEMQQAMEAQKKADANKLAAIEQAEGQKQSTILQAEGNRQSTVAQAQGEQEAILLRAQADRDARIFAAEGEARAIERLAQAQAEAIQTINQSIIAAFDKRPAGEQEQDRQLMLQWKYLETLTTIGQSPATKIVVPEMAQNFASLLTSATTLAGSPVNADASSATPSDSLQAGSR